jgi:hypothetical protein
VLPDAKPPPAGASTCAGGQVAYALLIELQRGPAKLTPLRFAATLIDVMAKNHLQHRHLAAAAGLPLRAVERALAADTAALAHLGRRIGYAVGGDGCFRRAA